MTRTYSVGRTVNAAVVQLDGELLCFRWIFCSLLKTPLRRVWPLWPEHFMPTGPRTAFWEVLLILE